MKKLFTALLCCAVVACSVNSLFTAPFKAMAEESAVLEFSYVAKDQTFTVGGTNMEVPHSTAFYAVSGTSSTGDVKISVPATYNDGEHGQLPVLAIENNAFYLSDANIVEVDFSSASNLKYIGSFAFADCYSLKGDLVINNVTQLIGRSSFKGTEISSLTIGNEVVAIEENAFALCENLKGQLNLPNKVEEIGETAFIGTKITAVNLTVNSSLKTIGAMAFKDTPVTGELILTENFESLGNYAFAGTTLNKVLFNATTKVAKVGYEVFPSTVTTIDITNYNAYLAYAEEKSGWAEYNSLLNYAEPDSYSVSVQSTDNGDFYLSSSEVVAGATVTITFVPKAGKQPKKFFVNGEEVQFTKSGTSYVYRVAVWNNILVSVEFEGEVTSESESASLPLDTKKGCGSGLASTLPLLFVTGVALIVRKRSK